MGIKWRKDSLKDKTYRERISVLERLAAEKDAEITELELGGIEREIQITELELESIERDAAVTELELAVLGLQKLQEKGE